MPASPFQIAQWRADGTLCPRCRQARQHPPQRYCAPCLIECGTPPLNIAREHIQLIRRLQSGWGGVDPAKRAQEEAARVREAYLARKRADYLKRKREAEAVRRAEAKKPKRKRAVSALSILKSMANPTAEEREAAGLPPKKRKSYYKPRRKRVPYRSERKYKPRFWTKTL